MPVDESACNSNGVSMKPASVMASRPAGRVALFLALALVLAAGAPRPALAQLSLPGGSQVAIGLSALGVHAAYDPVNNVYLVVGANNHVTGVFVNTLGQPVTGNLTLKGNGPGDVYGAFP